MLTVLFATKNRASILKSALESYCHLVTPASGWKLVVVDNGSTDETADVLSGYSGRLPLSSIIEHRPGKNHALNAGLELLEGDLTVLTDDDVFPHSDWLIEMRKVADAQLAYSVFGGEVIPRWEIPPLDWIRWVELGPAFGMNDTSQDEGPVSESWLPNIIGPNMAVRSSIFHMGVRFDPSIGPRGTSYPMGSETELILRLHRQGHKAWHAKGAVVEHLIRKEQLNKDWVLRRAIRFGRGWCRMVPNRKQWLGIPRYLIRDVPKEALHLAAATLSFNPKARFCAKWRLNRLLGEGYESFLMARERSARSNASIQ
jgi:glycosyltransferase involved in cell wall biosynthesis